MNKDQVRNVDLARIGFGHAIAATELQMASVYAKITTGYDVTPHILSSIDSEDEVLYQENYNKKKLDISDETIAIVNQMLSNNINSEGDYTFIPGYDVGGKTGTAQKYDENGQIATGKYISSFIGTYPASNPKYIIIVCVNEPSNGVYYGGVVAKPIGERVLKSIFETKSFAPTDISQIDNQPSIEMPYVVGMSLADACASLKKLGLDVLLDKEGEVVIEQLPPEGTLLYLGEIVYLITN